MLKRLAAALRPTVLWSYRRGSWQYDLLVAAILAFIFLTPRSFFGEGRLAEIVSESAMLDVGAGTFVYPLDAAALDGVSPDERTARIERLLRERTGRDLAVVAVQAAPEGAGPATLVYARPR